MRLGAGLGAGIEELGQSAAEICEATRSHLFLLTCVSRGDRKLIRGVVTFITIDSVSKHHVTSPRLSLSLHPEHAFVYNLSLIWSS